MAKPSSLNEAMLDMRSRRIKLVKDATANYGNYATLGNVLETLEPHLLECGLIVEQYPDHIEGSGAPALTTLILHAETDTSRSYTAALILDKETPQGVGSAITYMRRYALVSAFGLDADEDDDGQSAERATPKVHKVKKDDSAKPRVL